MCVTINFFQLSKWIHVHNAMNMEKQKKLLCAILQTNGMHVERRNKQRQMNKNKTKHNTTITIDVNMHDEYDYELSTS